MKTLEIDPVKVAPFRFKKFSRTYLLTNETGDFVFLSEQDFGSFVSGEHERLQSRPPKMYGELAAKKFINVGLDVNA